MRFLSRMLCAAFAGVVFVAATAAPVSAQGTSGAVIGTVTSEAGDVVAGAQVVARHLETGFTFRSDTDRRGRYRLPPLVVGPYSVVVRRLGFGAVETSIFVRFVIGSCQSWYTYVTTNHRNSNSFPDQNQIMRRVV